MMREMMRRLFELLVNNVREHFMIYLALWLLLAFIDLIWLWFFWRLRIRDPQLRIQPTARFIKDLIAILAAGAQFSLLLFRQLMLFHAGFATAAGEFLRAGRTLNKQQVATIVQAVGMAVAGGAALMAMGDNII